MSAANAHTRVLILLSILSGAGVFALFLLFERPGLGIGHGFYLAIGLAALALGVAGGAFAGAAATALFTIGVVVNDELPTHDIVSTATPIRFATFVGCGALLGWYARRNRQLTDDLTDALAELRVLAARDGETGLGNTRAFEEAVTAWLRDERPFALLLASVSTDAGDAPEVARELALRLPRHLPHDADVTRVSSDTFAVLIGCSEREQAGQIAARIERALDGAAAQVTIGWSTTPADGDTPLSLYRAAEERLYVRRMVLARRSPAEPPLTLA